MTLHALQTNQGKLLCADCAEEKYPDEDFPDDFTPIYEEDDWHNEVDGPCEACGEFVGP